MIETEAFAQNIGLKYLWSCNDYVLPAQHALNLGEYLSHGYDIGKSVQILMSNTAWPESKAFYHVMTELKLETNDHVAVMDAKWHLHHSHDSYYIESDDNSFEIIFFDNTDVGVGWTCDVWFRGRPIIECNAADKKQAFDEAVQGAQNFMQDLQMAFDVLVQKVRDNNA